MRECQQDRSGREQWMPTYVYKFVDTGETFEVQQSFHEPALTEAPHPTDGMLKPVRKVFTPVGVTFKGSGFYKTDSRNGRGRRKASGAEASGEGGATATKADTTPNGGGSSGDAGASTTKKAAGSATRADA